MVFWHPKGWALWQQVEQYMRQVYRDNGYQEVRAPLILDVNLWKASGHWENYKENMFFTESEKREFAVKPMNCPGHVQIFNKGLRSYRDLPLRYGEFGACHRNEPSGALHGLMRVRGFTQDDGHIFCTEDQIQPECAAFTTLLQKVYADFDFTGDHLQGRRRGRKSASAPTRSGTRPSTRSWNRCAARRWPSRCRRARARSTGRRSSIR
jgi:threonyl-tRNA synthetase